MKIVGHLVSHVIPVLVSLPHLLSTNPPQHEAPLGQHDLLQDDTVHRAPLPKPIRSTSSAKEPPSHDNYESGGNPRNTSPASYEPTELATTELATISGSSLEDIYQFFDFELAHSYGGYHNPCPLPDVVQTFGEEKKPDGRHGANGTEQRGRTTEREQVSTTSRANIRNSEPDNAYEDADEGASSPHDCCHLSAHNGASRARDTRIIFHESSRKSGGKH